MSYEEKVSYTIHDSYELFMSAAQQIWPGWVNHTISANVDKTNLIRAELEISIVRNGTNSYNSVYKMNDVDIFGVRGPGVHTQTFDVTYNLAPGKNTFQAIENAWRPIPSLLNGSAFYTSLLHLYYPIDQVPDDPVSPPPVIPGLPDWPWYYWALLLGGVGVGAIIIVPKLLHKPPPIMVVR